MNSFVSRIFTLFLLISITLTSHAQRQGYWQQAIEYEMDINMDAENHQFSGTQEITYYNNSPDTLRKVFFHLYFNAFQPGSMMDIRSRTIEDPDSRVGDRISKLKEDEIGYHKIRKLEQDGASLEYEIVGTVMEVKLADPLRPGKKADFSLAFDSQVPLQIRRSGRDNKEGIEFSMSQWYPKMAEYDYHGWHADPYVAREFHGVWGDFDVTIHMDSNYVIGGTGVLQNPQEVGHGYEDPEKQLKRPDSKKLTWHFQAEKVHDFVWAADPDYAHTTHQVPDGPELHFLYQTDTLQENWEKLPEKTSKAFQYMNEHFGKYPHDKYSVIQGGDGGMEYPMATLITGHRSFKSLMGVTAHEMNHSWYQMVLASNENMYPWMDEGFTVYSSDKVMQHLFDRKRPHRGSYSYYFRVAESGKEEPMSVHADAYHTNAAYGVAAYSKGCVFLHQLSYVVGEEAFMKGMRRYYNTWKFHHPQPVDFKHVMEAATGIELDWYFQYWLNTTRQADFSLREVEYRNDSALVTLESVGKIPMPIDLKVTFEDGSEVLYYIPLRMMRNEKAKESETKRILLEDWPWPYPFYEVGVPVKDRTIQKIEIDPSGRLADIDRSNNVYPGSDRHKFRGKTKQLKK